MKQILLMLCTLLCLCASTVKAQSGEEQAKRQARSVHLIYQGYQGPEEVLYMETTVDQVAPGSYICVVAFSEGYMGVQQLSHGEHVAIFSVWEPGGVTFGAKEKDVADAVRTKALYHGDFVHVSRFGGEGTGGKSMVGFKWEVGKPVIMAISRKPDGDTRTAYTGWIWMPDVQSWFQMATFSSLAGGKNAYLSDPYSFVEDFKRDVKSKEHVRSARFSRLWVHNGKAWSASPYAQFSADNNTLKTIDAGPSAEGFWLATGGNTENRATPLWGKIPAGGVSDESEFRRERLLQAIKAQK